jgi:hypothetical protein
MNTTLLFNNFTSGEVSPKLMARPDLAQYNFGAKELVNVIPLRQGGLRKRPGSWFDGYTYGEAKARLGLFKHTDGTVFVFEFTNLVCRIWKSDFTLFGAPLLVTTPYATADLPGLKWAVSGGAMWITHHSYAPRKITYNGTTFAISTPTFTGNFTFASAGNYPASIMFDAGRLWFSGMDNDPTAVIGSRAPDSAAGTNRYTDFTIGANSSYAIYLRESDMTGSRILWLFPGKYVVAGTDQAVWTDSGDVPTPALFDMNIAAYSGVSSVQAVGIAGVILYIGRGGLSLKSMVYSSAAADFVEGDLSVGADHILIPGVTEFDVATYPEPMVWFARSDGVVVSCTADLRGQVIAFARHNFGGEVESLIVSPGSSGDIVWMSIKRTVTNSSNVTRTVRSIEHMFLSDIYDDDIEEAHYVDSGMRIAHAPASDVISGMTHLAAKEVTVLADGAPLGTFTVALDATVTNETEFSIAHVGLPIESIVRPMSPELPANGTSMGKKRRIEKAAIKLYQSLGGKIGSEGKTLVPILYARYGTLTYGEAIAPFTGDIDVPNIPGEIVTEMNIRIEHDDPVPFNLLAIITKIAVLEA